MDKIGDHALAMSLIDKSSNWNILIIIHYLGDLDFRRHDVVGRRAGPVVVCDVVAEVQPTALVPANQRREADDE